VSQPKPFRLSGVMGWPVGHSRSPLLHGYWLKEHGLDGAYVLLEVPPERLDAALAGLPALGFAGCNVTIPHKEAVLARLDEVTPIARRIGAVNCITVSEDGRLSGTNHDGYGYIESLREAAPAFRADRGPAVVLGAGGSARAVIAALLEAGAAEIRLANRTPKRAEQLAELFGPAVRPLAWEQRSAALDGAALLVNTTSQGMIGQPPLEIALGPLPRAALVSDIVYVPLETALLAAARARGNPTVNGLGMLLHQARPAFAAWFGVMPSVSRALRCAIEATIG
jgi:shikimate dehydrogenase